MAKDKEEPVFLGETEESQLLRGIAVGDIVMYDFKEYRVLSISQKVDGREAFTLQRIAKSSRDVSMPILTDRLYAVKKSYVTGSNDFIDYNQIDIEEGDLLLHFELGNLEVMGVVFNGLANDFYIATIQISTGTPIGFLWKEIKADIQCGKTKHGYGKEKETGRDF